MQRGHLRSRLLRIDCRFIALNQVFVKGVLHIRKDLPTIQPTTVRFVLGEQYLRLTRANQPALPILPVLQLGTDASWRASHNSRRRTPWIPAPRPRIAKPQRWQQMQSRGVRPTIHGSDTNQDIFYVSLRVLHKNIEVSIFREHPRIKELEFRLILPAPAVLLN